MRLTDTKIKALKSTDKAHIAQHVKSGGTLTGIDVRDFVPHGFRRTASTNLHEAGFNSDWIEKCLAHETKGNRGVYNRAQYTDQRREMLQWWADFVDSQIHEERGRVIIGPFGKAY